MWRGGHRGNSGSIQRSKNERQYGRKRLPPQPVSVPSNSMRGGRHRRPANCWTLYRSWAGYRDGRCHLGAPLLHKQLDQNWEGAREGTVEDHVMQFHGNLSHLRMRIIYLQMCRMDPLRRRALLIVMILSSLTVDDEDSRHHLAQFRSFFPSSLSHGEPREDTLGFVVIVQTVTTIKVARACACILKSCN